MSLIADFGDTWKDRIGEAVYIDPNGTEHPFQYTDVSMSFERRGRVFSYPTVDGEYVQDAGRGSRKFPLKCYFSGGACDLKAQAFMDALSLPGIGTLKHPMYGEFDVSPLGEITRNDALATAANQAVVELTFWETIGAVYPALGLSLSIDLTLNLESFNLAAVSQFSASSILKRINNRAHAVNRYRDAMRSIRRTTRQIANAESKVRNAMSEVNRQIDQALDTLIEDPLDLAQNTLRLFQLPGEYLDRTLARIDALGRKIPPFGTSGLSDRVKAFGLLGGELHTEFLASVGSAIGDDAANEAQIGALMSAGAISGSLSAIGSAELTTRAQATGAIEAINAQLEAHQEFSDAIFAAAGTIDSGEGYQSLRAAVDGAISYLIQQAISLQPQRAIVLDRERALLELCAELYGTVDDRLDFFIATNALSGDEILTLPAGRKVVYFA